MPNLSLLLTDSRELNQVQQNIKNVLQPVFNNPMLFGVSRQSVVVGSGSNVIEHGLGHDVNGWIVTDINAAVTLYRSASNAQTITLVSSGTATVDLYIY